MASATWKVVCVALVISAALVAPFVVLEWVNRTGHDEFPFALFAFMALLSLGIVLSVTPAVRRLWSEPQLGALRIGHWAGVVAFIFLALFYVDLVSDQLPCFLGVPNCD